MLHWTTAQANSHFSSYRAQAASGIERPFPSERRYLKLLEKISGETKKREILPHRQIPSSRPDFGIVSAQA
jgi:hypothetical protein